MWKGYIIIKLFQTNLTQVIFKSTKFLKFGNEILGRLGINFMEIWLKILKKFEIYSRKKVKNLAEMLQDYELIIMLEKFVVWRGEDQYRH